jgi:hypothetical protein
MNKTIRLKNMDSAHRKKVNGDEKEDSRQELGK